MWTILEAARLQRVIPKLPLEIRQRYEFWKNVVRVEGSQGLRRIRGFNDEALKGEWKGFRSSRLNRQYRVIYSVQADRIEIHVVAVTPHDYRRK
jgi:addiction module RelE/StbE family toxin